MPSARGSWKREHGSLPDHRHQRRTGKRRLYGRQASARYRAAPPIVDTGLPWQAPEPPAGPEEPDPSRYLTEADRIHIADRLREKASVRAIAAELGRSPSTVSREIAATARSSPTAAGPTVRTPPSAARTPANRAPGPARSPRTPGCGTSSRTT
ncbi:helix-turn-helix domain-containing protein [Streptomyces sp. NPDC046832]|uniref:helix-turn-helix domain-containing protein n=1 Tax=Streptomyces sp. NPDC046832 TaxID=3155020 RepID=UPI0033C6EFA0